MPKIVKLGELLKMREGTIFSEYKPQYTSGLYRFDGQCGPRDFYYQDLLGTVGDNNTPEFDLNSGSRWALYDEDEEFFVYEEEEVEILAEALAATRDKEHT